MRVGYSGETVAGLYRRLYFGVHEPQRLYMIDGYGWPGLSAGGVVSNEGPLGHLIEDPQSYSSRLEGSELSISMAKFAGVSRTTVTLTYFIGAGQQYFTFTHRPMMWGLLMDDLNVTKLVRRVELSSLVPQFPVKDLRKGMHVWENIFS